MLEISKVLTISTAHITGQTAKALEREPDTNGLGLSVHDKSGYGWFIMNIQDIGNENCCGFDEIPSDLSVVIQFAKDVGVDVLCLDCDGEEVDYLPKYNW